jgi:formylmethanofuran dehydrogenase subunit E
MEFQPMAPFDELLKASVEQHGHLCAGQVIGVRMAMLGCRLVGVDDPQAPEYRKKLMVFVEIDRCATDAIQSVTGCRMGKRTLKFKDFGINAATFVNLETREAVRIVSTESSRETCGQYAPGQTDPKQRQLEGYAKMPDDLLFDIQRVRVDLPEWEMPGPPRRHAVCSRCGQMVRDGKERRIENQILCRPCAGEGYYHPMENHQAVDASGQSQKEHTP